MTRPLIAVATAAMLLAGCVITPTTSVVDNEALWQQRQATIRGFTDWELNGRMALRTPDQGWNGQLTWRQHDAELDLRVNGPLGIGGFHINGDDSHVRLRTSDGEEHEFSNPQRELEQRLGWSVPLGALRFWVLGVPEPATATERQLDSAGRLTELEQLGWQVRYERYGDAGGIDMPRKLRVSGDGVTIKLVVDRWDLGQDTT